MFDELVETKFTSDGKAVVTRRLISDEEQIHELDLLEASIAFASAKARAATTREPADIEEAQEREVKLVNLFFNRDPNPALRRAWAAYRRRLLFDHRAEG
jgi:hypothetical protein